MALTGPRGLDWEAELRSSVRTHLPSRPHSWLLLVPAGPQCPVRSVGSEAFHDPSEQVPGTAKWGATACPVHLKPGLQQGPRPRLCRGWGPPPHGAPPPSPCHPCYISAPGL